jgi:hypothetical protein
MHQWKKFDEKYYLEFGKNMMNVHFELNSDEMNPFGERTKHSHHMASDFDDVQSAYMTVLKEKISLLPVLI